MQQQAQDQSAMSSDDSMPVGLWRESLISLLLLIGFTGLLVRLYEVQIPGQNEFAGQVARQRLSHRRVMARPGQILDRHGRVLATTVMRRSLFIDPAKIPDARQTAHSLGQILGLDAERLSARFMTHSGRRFLWVKRRLTESEATRVEQLKLPPDCWGFRQEFLREYPQGKLASHVLGLRNIDGDGIGGIEQTQDARLRGMDGQRLVERDALGRIIAIRREISRPAQPGRSVQLTLDSVIQLVTEQELDRIMEEVHPESACAIVMDPQNGDLLAVASRPSIDPLKPELNGSRGWVNHAVTSIYEPGSTLKPLVVGWAMKNGVLQPGEQIDCERGEYRMGRRLLHDHHPYSELSIRDILVKSSNIGMAKIGERLGNTELHACLKAFGLGRPTGIPLTAESGGHVRPLTEWTSYSTGSIPMGQEIGVTPLQLITAHACLANGGHFVSPRLVMRLGSDAAVNSVLRRSCLPEPVARWLVDDAMRSVVAEGTGRRAKIDGVAVFGKTGTAQKVDMETGRYSDSRHVCSFICGAPADAPRLLVLVIVDEPAPDKPQFGGIVAAPPASRILERALERVPIRRVIAAERFDNH